jgi:hypothetical protein
MRLILLLMDRAHRDDSKTPLLVFIRPLLEEKSTIIRIEVSVVVLMKSIILSMDGACSHLSKTTIGSIQQPTTSIDIDVLGCVITGVGYINPELDVVDNIYLGMFDTTIYIQICIVIVVVVVVVVVW